MKKAIDSTEAEQKDMELLAKFKEGIASPEQHSDTSQEPSCFDEIFAKSVATFCLENNIKADKLNTLFRYQLIDILKKSNPKISNVEISARTGIDRRWVNTINKSVKQSKDMLILSYLKSYCKTNKTTHIKIKGHCNSFEHFCILGANGSLTAKSISDELLRLGHIKDKGSRYQIIFEE